jgi:hypothetical protein
MPVGQGRLVGWSGAAHGRGTHRFVLFVVGPSTERLVVKPATWTVRAVLAGDS